MSIDAQPALAAEREARERAIEPVAAACATRIDVTSADADHPAALRERVPEGALVACLDVLDRVPAFAALVEALQELARDKGATVVLGVPNDQLGAPGASSWTDGAVEELRSVLGPGAVVAGVHELRGAAVVPEGTEPPGSVEVAGALLAPVGWLLAFGAHAQRLGARAVAGPVDTVDQRRHVLALEADRDALRALRDH
ncbi:MAG TPA: hypothetical protein VD931_09800 [Baekduia sp.]|nr:hypothetical protein [Baekduia sp.]